MLSHIALPVAIAMLVLVVVSLSLFMGIKGQTVLLAALLGIPVVAICFADITLGAKVVLGFSFFLLGIKRLIGSVSLGLAMDALILLLFLGHLIRSARARRTLFKTNPRFILIVLWIFYNFLEVLNPYATSKMAWLYTIRSSAGFMLMYFVFGASMDSKKQLKSFIWLWFILAFITGLYGLKQEFLGFFPYELHWVTSSPERYALLFIMGRFRKFSVFDGPMVFGVLMSITAMAALIIALETKEKRQR